jgi:cytidine deaminase
MHYIAMKEFILNTKITVYHIDECSDIEKKLIEAAKSATKKAYAPYSQFKVGAAVLLENGEIVIGTNQENAAYPSGLCAERTAIFSANANFPEHKVEAIAIAAFYKGKYSTDVTPCGGCRQVLLETETRFKSPIKILISRDEEIYKLDNATDLLPLHFGEEMLQ